MSQRFVLFNPTKRERRSVFPIHLEGEMQNEMSGTRFAEAHLSGG